MAIRACRGQASADVGVRAIVAAIAASRQSRSTTYPRSSPSIKPLRTRASSSQVLAAGSAPIVHAPVKPIDEPTRLDSDTTAASGSGPSVVASGSGPTEVVAALPVGIGSAAIRLPRGAIGIGPYIAAAVPAGRRAPDDMFAPRYLTELGKCVEQVLAAEAPIHIDLIARRVAAYVGIGRVTPRVLEQVQSALLGRGRWGDEKGIVWRLDQDPARVPTVRVAGTTGTSKRDIADKAPRSLELHAHKITEVDVRKVGDRVLAANTHWFGVAAEGRMWLVKGNWNDGFLGQLDGFTQIAHDDKVTSVTSGMSVLNPARKWAKMPFVMI